jgi:hypothetical protein
LSQQFKKVLFIYSIGIIIKVFIIMRAMFRMWTTLFWTPRINSAWHPFRKHDFHPSFLNNFKSKKIILKMIIFISIKFFISRLDNHVIRTGKIPCQGNFRTGHCHLWNLKERRLLEIFQNSFQKVYYTCSRMCEILGVLPR